LLIIYRLLFKYSVYLEFPFVHSRIFFLTEQSVAARIIRPLRTVSRVLLSLQQLSRGKKKTAQ